MAYPIPFKPSYDISIMVVVKVNKYSIIKFITNKRKRFRKYTGGYRRIKENKKDLVTTDNIRNMIFKLAIHL